MTKDSSGNYHQRLHALDLTTGAELFGGPTEIQATYPGTGDGSQNGQLSCSRTIRERAGYWNTDHHLHCVRLALRRPSYTAG